MVSVVALRCSTNHISSEMLTTWLLPHHMYYYSTIAASDMYDEHTAQTIYLTIRTHFCLFIYVCWYAYVWCVYVSSFVYHAMAPTARAIHEIGLKNII